MYNEPFDTLSSTLNTTEVNDNNLDVNEFKSDDLNKNELNTEFEDVFNAEFGDIPSDESEDYDGTYEAEDEYEDEGIVGFLDPNIFSDEFKPIIRDSKITVQSDFMGDALNIEGSFDNTLESFEDEDKDEDAVIEEENTEIVQDDNIFDTNGDIVVMDTHGDAFHLAYIDISNIVVTDRIRKVTTVEALKTSIEKTGLLKPIVVANTATKGTYVLIDGYKRLLASAKCGLTRIPCIVNNKVKTTDLSIVEALYNHYTAYTVQEMIDYINYLEKEKGILNQSTIELLLQMEPGHYPKLKDILNDNDPAILEKLLSGSITIDQAFSKLKSKRAKQSKEEKELQKATTAYSTEDGEKVSLDGTGDIGTGEGLTDQEIADLGVAPNLLDVKDKSVEELLKEGDSINGFEDKVQKVGEREYIDPAMRKAVMARDNNTCQCCFEGGESYVDVNDFHHILPVFLGGPDNVDNAVCLCVKCHKLVHLHARGQLHLPPMDSLSEADKEKFKHILSYGNYIRKGMEKKGMKLDDYKKKDKINKIGRQMPGTKNTVS